MTVTCPGVTLQAIASVATAMRYVVGPAPTPTSNARAGSANRLFERVVVFIFVAPLRFGFSAVLVGSANWSVLTPALQE